MSERSGRQERQRPDDEWHDSNGRKGRDEKYWRVEPEHAQHFNDRHRQQRCPCRKVGGDGPQVLPIHSPRSGNIRSHSCAQSKARVPPRVTHVPIRPVPVVNAVTGTAVEAPKAHPWTSWARMLLLSFGAASPKRHIASGSSSGVKTSAPSITAWPRPWRVSWRPHAADDALHRARQRMGERLCGSLQRQKLRAECLNPEIFATFSPGGRRASRSTWRQRDGPQDPAEGSG